MQRDERQRGVGSHLFNLFLARIARPGGVSNRCGDSCGVDLQ
jgi:hypothetical protein